MLDAKQHNFDQHPMHIASQHELIRMRRFVFASLKAADINVGQFIVLLLSCECQLYFERVAGSRGFFS
jgi:hypothetical protein